MSDEVQITLRVPKDLADKMTSAAQRFGMPRNAFFIQLFQIHEAATALDNDERDVVLHLGVWGLKNFKETPDLEKFAGMARFSVEGVRRTIKRLIRKGLLNADDASTKSSHFDRDILVDDVCHRLTREGEIVAGILLNLYR